MKKIIKHYNDALTKKAKRLVEINQQISAFYIIKQNQIKVQKTGYFVSATAGLLSLILAFLFTISSTSIFPSTLSILLVCLAFMCFYIAIGYYGNGINRYKAMILSWIYVEVILSSFNIMWFSQSILTIVTKIIGLIVFIISMILADKMLKYIWNHIEDSTSLVRRKLNRRY